MGKSVDDQLQDTFSKKEKLIQQKNTVLLQIKQTDEFIKSLQKKKKQAEGESILRKIEARGFTIEDVLRTMEQKHTKEEE